jgi:putative hydrolase of the HAD superfamily
VIEKPDYSSVVVFDLDDTLYPEHDFVASGFQAVDALLRARGIRRFLPVAQQLFQGGLRGRIFDCALEQIGTIPSPELVAELIAEYRSHAPRLSLFPDARWVLDHFATSTIGLLTDGFSQTQRNKVRALGIEPRFAAIVYTDDLGRAHWKPSPAPFEKIASLLGMQHEMHRLVYVADNPKKDFIAPNQLGWTTIRIQRGAGEYTALAALEPSHAAHHEITSLEMLPHILESLSVSRA